MMGSVDGKTMKLGRQIDVIQLADNEYYGDVYHVTVLRDNGEVTLIDAGIVGQFEVLSQQLDALGIKVKDITRVLVTHADIDHIGTLFELKASNPDMEVWAHEEDAKCLNGEGPFEKLDETPALKAYFERFQKPDLLLKVSRNLEDGEVLPILGGMEVIHTPGHTRGHLSFYIQDQKILIAGDAIGCEEGQLVPPSPEYTPDMPLAMESMKKLLQKEAKVVLCYHGGAVPVTPQEN